MVFRAAAASSDGVHIDRHFGHADTFFIYEIKDGCIHFIEKRAGISPCQHGKHEEGVLLAAAELLKDCRYVFVEAIGGRAADALSGLGIIPLEIGAGEAEIDEALREVAGYEERRASAFGRKEANHG